MTRFAPALRRIGSPDAVSWPVFWVTLGAGFLGNAVSNAGSPLGVRLAVVLLGQVALWLPLGAVGVVLRRRPERPRPLLVLSAAVVGLAVRAVVIGATLGRVVGQDAALWTDRFVGALFNVGLSFVVAAYVVTALRERRRQITTLQATERRLAAAVEEASAAYTERNEEAVAQVRSIIETELEALDPADAERSLGILQRTAADVVRPLSHELARVRPDPEPPTPVDVAVSWRQVLDDAARGAPFRPGLTAAILGVELLAATVAYPPGAPVFAVLFLAVWGLVAMANAVLRLALPGRSRIARITLMVIAAIGVGAGMAVIVATGLGDAPEAEELTVAALVMGAVVTLGVGIAASFSRDRARIAGQLEASSRALRRRVVRWRQAQWLQQKAVSRALHGPVQAAVTASALRLDEAIRAHAVDPALVGRLRDDLLEALAGLSPGDAGVVSLDEALHRLTATWEGLCDIAVHADPAAVAIVDADPLLRSCLIDIVTEAVSNAVRHGGATSARIELAADQADEADVLLAVEGSGPIGRPSGASGLGTRILDDCTLEWRLADGDTGARLTARLPAAV